MADESKPLIITKHVESGRVGQSPDKYYFQSDATFPTATVKYQVAFDGQLAENSSSFQPDMISEGHNTRDYQPGNPEPAAILDVLEPGTLQQMVGNGELLCTAGNLVRNGLDAHVRLEFVSTGKNNIQGYKTEVAYDAQRDFLTTSFKNTDPNGRILVESSDIQLATFAANGNTFFYPVSGVLKQYAPTGALAQTSSLNMDVKTGLAINGAIDPSKFRLATRAGEKVWNSDLKLAVVDPGKQLDLDRALGDALNPDGEPNSEKAAQNIPSANMPATEAIAKRPTAPSWLLVTLGAATLACAIILWRKSSRERETGT
jgi:hypothetical protein